MLRVVVMVSGGGTNLQAILDAVDAGRITNTEIVGVISNNKNAYAVPRAAVVVLLVEHRGGHEGRRRMPRGEGVARRSVGAHHTAGVFERVDPDGHESRRKGVGDQHAAP